ncbi:MAG: ATP-dependent helicase HrpB [Pseudomonadota bacterium]
MKPISLPIDDCLDGLVSSLGAHANAVVIAPPGSGKSTGVAPALVGAPWATGRQIILLQPRRVAVRALAHRLAALRGESVGGSVGYVMRGEVRVSADTRIVVMTLGVLRRKILADPELNDVTALLFDEFHERALDADICFALARDVQANLRPDLRLLVMSATLDEATILPKLQDFSVHRAEGRSFPIETTYLPPHPNETVPAQLSRAVRKALAESTGDILCFLPGVRDIRRSLDILAERFEGATVDIMPLYGALPLKEQQVVVAPHDDSKRRIILATDIAETSLTLAQVDTVIDLGLRRAPVFDPVSGLTQLKTTKASRASVDQRQGRAGRVRPGRCYRLWAQQATRALQAADPPDILVQDVSDLVLGCCDWGAADISSLSWVDQPPPSSIARARDSLISLGLLNEEGAITPAGRLAVQLPLPTDLAAFLIAQAGSEHCKDAALLCALMAEDIRGLQAAGEDLKSALAWLKRAKTPQALTLKKRAGEWAERVAQSVPQTSAQEDGASDALGLALARYRLPLIAQARAGEVGRFKLSSGRGAYVDEVSSLANADYLVVGEGVLAGTEVRIQTGWPLKKEEVQAALSDLCEQHEDVDQDASGFVSVTTKTMLRALVLGKQRERLKPGPRLAAALHDSLMADGLRDLPWPKRFIQFQARAAFARTLEHGLPDMSFDALKKTAQIWLKPLLETVSSLQAIDGKALEAAVVGLTPYDAQRTIETLAPPVFTLPTGHDVPINYQADGPPSVAGKLQGFFGLSQHPMVGKGRVPLSLELLSPAGRPLQTTQDLPGFWAGSYQQVRKDMRGRYPKHPWPEDPANAKPSLMTKKRAAASGKSDA